MKDDSKGQCNSIGTSRWHSATICFLRDHDADLEALSNDLGVWGSRASTPVGMQHLPASSGRRAEDSC